MDGAGGGRGDSDHHHCNFSALDTVLALSWPVLALRCLGPPLVCRQALSGERGANRARRRGLGPVFLSQVPARPVTKKSNREARSPRVWLFLFDHLCHPLAHCSQPLKEIISTDSFTAAAVTEGIGP